MSGYYRTTDSEPGTSPEIKAVCVCVSPRGLSILYHISYVCWPDNVDMHESNLLYSTNIYTYTHTLPGAEEMRPIVYSVAYREPLLECQWNL